MVGLMLLGFSGFAQTQNAVTGNLIDETTGEALGFATVSLTRDGQSKPAKYTLSDDKGAFSMTSVRNGTYAVVVELMGYEPCHDADRVIDEAAYDPEADLPNTPDSVFCSHGAGYTVKWRDVRAHMHVEDEDVRRTPWREADAAFFGAQS